MKNTHLILFLFFTYYSCIPGTRDCFPQSQFQLVIGDSSNTEEARSIIQTTDGGYIVVGETGTNGDMYIVKLNSSGQLQWSRTIGGSGQDLALSVVQTTDGGFAVSGFGNSFGAGVAGAFIVKLTPGGAVEWAKVLADGFLDAAYSIVQTIDGGYVSAISPSEGGGSARMIIVKLNNAGNLQWSKNIGGVSFARSIKQTTDKGFVVAGATVDSGNFDFNMVVVKLDSNGSMQWTKTIGGTNDEVAYSIVQTTDGGYAVAGRTASFQNGDKMYVVKLNSSGLLQWTKVFSVYLDRAYSIVQTTDGGYAVAGYTGGGNAGMLILKLNPDGSLEWSRVIDGGSVQTYAYSIIKTTDGGYVATGYGGISGKTGMFFVKLDNNGNTCGNTISHNVSVESGGILGSLEPTVNNISLLVTTVTPSTGSQGYVIPICVIGIQPISNEIPDTYKLYQNYPNPFNPETKIKFSIPFVGTDLRAVSLNIYDISGRLVKTILQQNIKPGSYEITFDASGLSSGVYFYRINAGDFTDTKKMILLR